MNSDPLFEMYPDPTQPLFNYLSNEHGVDLLESDLQEVINAVKVIYQPKLKDALNACMVHLIDAHTLLSKSKLDTEQYNPISIELNYAKILLTKLINEL